MKILITGARGKLGRRLSHALPALGATTAFGRDGLDLARPDSIREAIRAARPDVIVNAAGYTRVDAAESEPELVNTVNAVAPGVLAEEAKRLGALLVHFSSVFVFDGLKPGPYLEHDTPCPVNAYGASKLRGEEAIAAVGGDHLILRASWVYDSHGRDDFVLTMLRLAAERDVLQVVDDQLGSPTSASALAEAAARALVLVRTMKAAPGIYNLAAKGSISRFDFTARLLDLAAGPSSDRPPPRLEAIKTSQFPLIATRPLNSVLSSEKLEAAGVSLTSWEEQLAGFVSTIDARR